MLSDREADEIERARKAKTAGPIVLKWVDLLLADRRERIRQLEHVRQRLHQAFRYLDGLVRDVQHVRTDATPDPAALCPRCGRPYARTADIPPRAIAYFHPDGRECRSGAPPAGARTASTR